MATDAERDRAFRRERARRARALPRIQRETADEVRRILRRADREIRARLAGDASDFERFLGPQTRRSIRQAIEQLGAQAGEKMAEGASRAWQAGVGLVDAPIDAAIALETPGAGIGANLASVDARQLRATRTFLTSKMEDVSVAVINRINTRIGLVATGAASPGEAVGQISKILGSTRSRAITIVRTELGRAYSVAGHERMTQARRVLPGLRKEWRRSGKLHSRLEHDAADGQVRDVDKPFDIAGVKLMYPRDPAGPAKETINCGCQSLAFMESWDRAPGRPFTEEELVASPERRDLQDRTPVSP